MEIVSDKVKTKPSVQIFTDVNSKVEESDNLSSKASSKNILSQKEK